jgi:hypothetical protein
MEEAVKVVCAFAERASGPGWANSPLWYIVRDGNGVLSMECLQPEEQGPEITMIYDVSASVHLALVAAVEKKLRKP